MGTTESTTESTTVKELSPVLEYTMLTQPTSMELEAMVPTHTHNTANSNKVFRYKMTLKSKNISQLRKIPKKINFFLSKFLLSIIMGNMSTRSFFGFCKFKIHCMYISIDTNV